MSLANEDVTVTDADRAKAAELLGQYLEKAVPDWAVDAIGAALADARAEADQLRDAMRALAEEWEAEARSEGAASDRHYELTNAAARVRDLADGGRR